MLSNREITAIDKAEGGRLVHLMSNWLLGCNRIQSGDMFDDQTLPAGSSDKEKISLLCVYYGLARLNSDNRSLFEHEPDDAVVGAARDALTTARERLSSIDDDMPQLLKQLDDTVAASPTQFVEVFDRESALDWNAVLVHASRFQFTSTTTPRQLVEKMDKISICCKEVCVLPVVFFDKPPFAKNKKKKKPSSHCFFSSL
jgi:hypothetical protein